MSAFDIDVSAAPFLVIQQPLLAFAVVPAPEFDTFLADAFAFIEQHAFFEVAQLSASSALAPAV
ncbi:MAG: hypothetical protein UZ06_CHB003001266 [Chlorobi bacterium OLB6]|nr:MAG: hypothetical protein UZ06_CHB003001266 [Chlorobi bacterium OLB6]